MEYTLFFTGYPGFLARGLLDEVLNAHGEKIDHIYLLVLEEEMEVAEKAITRHSVKEKMTLIPGDITKDNLGMEVSMTKKLEASITHLFHLAAIYDLAVPKKIAYNVNVHGTEMVTNWARNLKNLSRYIYFSTAYVSGTREGIIYETELNMNQDFKNHYEQTKFEAELIVEDAKKYLPTTIIRPGIVKGHSKTGETIKFDGIYFMLHLFDHLSFSPVLPYLGEGRVEGNFVPADYVLEATSYLAFQDKSKGKTYHLTDPNPYTMRELYRMVAKSYLGREPKGQIPLELARLPMNVRGIEKWLRVEKEALDYFTFDAAYDCSQALEDLAGSGISCPDFKETLEPMVAYYQKYKDDLDKYIFH